MNELQSAAADAQGYLDAAKNMGGGHCDCEAACLPMPYEACEHLVALAKEQSRADEPITLAMAVELGGTPAGSHSVVLYFQRSFAIVVSDSVLGMSIDLEMGNKSINLPHIRTRLQLSRLLAALRGE